MAVRSQPYRLEWPWNPLSVEQLDEMLQILFDDVRNGNLEVETSQISDLPLTPPDGGTGLTSYSIGDIIYANDTDSLTTLGIGSPNYVLQVNIAGDAPEWGLVAFDNMVPAAAPSTLIGRRSGSTGDWEAVTLGSGLAMSVGGELTASGSGNTTATYLTEADETADLPNSLQLLPGTGITFDTATPNELTINATATGSGGGWIPLVDGSEPPAFITDGAGVLILIPGP